ncbi:hypothetical protein P886_1169 [Alteromonadaceae bacterium 2753L.S.0a.02]|nr:hypothetical protein P886_1169 [Alteromonadaceae bacterium 2753L.S.0a.02]
MNPLKKSKRSLKRKVSKATGIPTTKSGRKRKADAIQGQAIFWLIVIGVVVYFLSSNSDAGPIETLNVVKHV